MPPAIMKAAFNLAAEGDYCLVASEKVAIYFERPVSSNNNDKFSLGAQYLISILSSPCSLYLSAKN